jgi:hypothetical protein
MNITDALERLLQREVEAPKLGFSPRRREHNSDCIGHSKRVRTVVGHIVQFEDYKQHRNKQGWRLTLKGAERLSQRWHDEAWAAWATWEPRRDR